jgi:hypothetical protein
MLQANDTKDVKAAVWFSSILRWVLGAVFITVGLLYVKKDSSAWILVTFGAVMFISGFFRPKRCVDGRCEQ